MRTIRKITHASAFVLVATSKTIYDIGAASLTADVTAKALFCLTHYHNKQATPNPGFKGINIGLQVITGILAMILVVISRYPQISKNLSKKGFKEIYHKLNEELVDCSRWRKAALIVIGLFGLLSCVARGLGAHLGTEVIFRERFHLEDSGVDVAAWIVGVIVAVASMCFNWANMLKEAAIYVKDPIFKPSLRTVFCFIAVLVGAVVTRFFIKEYLDRRHASVLGQVAGQSIFFAAEFIMGLFTIAVYLAKSKFEEAKSIMQKSAVFTILMLVDIVALWFAYTMITLYSILVDLFVEQSAVGNHGKNICPADHSAKDLVLRYSFLVASLIISIPATVGYFNYVLPHAKVGYDEAVMALRSPRTWCRQRFFADDQEQEHLLAESNSSINMPHASNGSNGSNGNFQQILTPV